MRSSLLRVLLPLASACLLSACGGGSSDSSSIHPSYNSNGNNGTGPSYTVAVSPSGSDDVSASDVNVVPVVVDNGGSTITPAGSSESNSLNTLFVSVTVCVPGTTTCQTVDHIQVDTGSSGLRLMYSELNSSFVAALPKRTDGNNHPIGECMQYADGNAWGSLRTANLAIGQESASNLTLQIIGDPALTEPSSCEAGGVKQENSPSTFGANGIIGINNLAVDCGSYCASTTNNGFYFACPTSSSCASMIANTTLQVPNPITLFTTDNNGSMLDMPAIPDTGATTVAGYLVFGINTRSNNAIGSATVMPSDSFGIIHTSYNSLSYDSSYFDSGTNELGVPANSGILTCGSGSYYCPPSMLSLSAVVTPGNGSASASSTLDFKIGNPITYFDANSALTALDNIAFPTPSDTSSGYFVWGSPYFFGHKIFTAIGGATVSGETTPFIAF